MEHFFLASRPVLQTFITFQGDCPTLPYPAPPAAITATRPPVQFRKKCEGLVRQASTASSAASALHRTDTRGQKCSTTLTRPPL
jgi:hypothetical protein